jgi:hypothetical protein
VRIINYNQILLVDPNEVIFIKAKAFKLFSLDSVKDDLYHNNINIDPEVNQGPQRKG